MILFVACANFCTAQTIKKSIINNTKDIENWIVNNYHPDSIKLSQLCQTSCVFIRFRILKGGKVTDVNFNKNAPAFITVALTTALHSMEDQASISDSLQTDGKPYLLPFNYNYQSGCRNVYLRNKLTLIQKDLEGHFIDSQQVGEAIFNMLNFADKKLSALNCIILNPISVSNTVMN
jgi:hypothetical protein